MAQRDTCIREIGVPEMRQIRKVDCILMQMQWANYPLWPCLSILQKPTRRARAAPDRELPTMFEPCEDHGDWVRANFKSEPPTLRFDQGRILLGLTRL